MIATEMFKDGQTFRTKGGQVIKVIQTDGCYVHISEWNESLADDKHESIVNAERLRNHLAEFNFEEVA